MNNEIFQQARLAYKSKDYAVALEAYTQCLQDARQSLKPGELGLLYHQIGNCLVKLKDYNEAIHAYSQATADTAYDAMGTLNYNLGLAYAALRDYEDAVKHFDIAAADAKYDTPYKAYTAMGNALMKLGKSAEAGVAFRQAALDEKNPDPTKALLNLGICFMSLNRPQDAVASYESALPFRMSPETRNKLFASLGQAYVASGQMKNAVTAFETALSDNTYHLNDSASVDYQRAVAAVVTGASEATASLAPVNADTSGLDVSAAGMPVQVAATEDEGYEYDQGQYYADDSRRAEGYPPGDNRFFTASDEELEQWSKGLAKQSRKRRNVGLKILLVVIIVLVLLLGAAVFGYTQGYGYPTQQATVEELFANPQGSADAVFANSVSEADANSMVSIVPTDSSITINAIDQAMTESVVYVTAQTAEGADQQYRITMVRDFIGWKVSRVELYFASQNQ